MRDTVLTIAGSDSSGGAGIQADLKAIAANGAYGASILTAITAQNTTGVARAEVLPPAVVRAQLDAVYSDLRIVAVKSGMLGNAEVIGEVAAALRRHPGPAYVCDPVLVSKNGHPLLAAECVERLRRDLLPLASLVTPNVHEASVLAGSPIASLADAERAGQRILAFGAGAVLVKGGHLSGAPGTDVLVTPAETISFRGEWIDNPNTHGTGCTLSAAIAAWLGRGCGLVEAVTRAKRFITEAIRAGSNVGSGVGPTEPFFFLRSESAARDWVRFLDVGGRSPAAVGSRSQLHVITDEQFQTGRTHAELARLAAENGADVVQFREKRPRTTAELVRTATEVARALEGSGVPLIVNDRADVAAAVGAAGVHLGRNDLAPDVARAFLGAGCVIGLTANSTAEAARAAAQSPGYIGAGPVFGTRTKDNPAPELGLAGLRSIVGAAAGAPVIAIGSIVPERVAEVLATGVTGVAVASAVVCDRDPGAATRRLRAALDAGDRAATVLNLRNEGRP